MSFARPTLATSSKATATSRPASSTAPARPPPSTSSTRPPSRSSAPSTGNETSSRSSTNAAAASALKTRTVPSRFLGPTVPATALIAPLAALNELYTISSALVTLRATSVTSDASFLSTTHDLEQGLLALEKEVGEGRQRRGVEGDVELLEEMQRGEGKGWVRVLEELAEVLGESVRMDECDEDELYRLQVALHVATAKLERIDTTGLPKLAALKPPLISIASFRQSALAATRSSSTSTAAAERFATRNGFKALLLSSV